MTETLPAIQETVEQIKSHGFWEVIIRPLKFEKDHIKTLGECAKLIEENKVLLRGWDYPHVSSKYRIKSGTDWVENLTNWNDHKEYWRMYRSGQFFHLFAFREDWWGNVQIFRSQQTFTTPDYGLEIICTLYTITEIYQFAARLAQRGIFDDSLKISITLNGTKNRRLVTSEINRSLLDDYVCIIKNIPLSRTIGPEEIITKANVFAIDDTMRIFERFNLFDPPRKVFEEEQSKLIKGNV